MVVSPTSLIQPAEARKHEMERTGDGAAYRQHMSLRQADAASPQPVASASEERHMSGLYSLAIQAPAMLPACLSARAPHATAGTPVLSPELPQRFFDSPHIAPILSHQYGPAQTMHKGQDKRHLYDNSLLAAAQASLFSCKPTNELHR